MKYLLASFLLTDVVRRPFVIADGHTYPTIVDLSVDFEEAAGLNKGQWAEDMLVNAANTSEIRRVLVLQHGQVVVNYTRDDVDNAELFPIWSATKSWISLIFGMMVDDGDVMLNETLGDIWPSDNSTNDALWESVNDAEFRRDVTIESMLTMSSGLITPMEEDLSNANSSTLPPDDGTWGGANLTHALNQPSNGPVGNFSYLGSSNILSYVIQTRTGLSPREFASTKIFPMLGIEDENIAWDLNLDGMQYAYHGLNMTAEQLAKFGQLYLQHGLAGPNEEGNRVVSQDWVEKSGSPLVPTLFPLVEYYGYLFWLLSNEMYCAIGFGSQLVCINESKDTVFVQQAEYNSTIGFTLIAEPLLQAMNVTSEGGASEGGDGGSDVVAGEVKAAGADSSGGRKSAPSAFAHSAGLLFSLFVAIWGV